LPIRNWLIILLLVAGLAYAAYRLFFYRRPLGPVPATWRKILRDHVAFYRRLPPERRPAFEARVQQFLAEVTITGVDCTVSETDRLLVAASAVIPIFGFPNWRYPNLNEVLLYRGAFNHDYQTDGDETNVLGMVGSGAMNRMMILSLPELRLGFRQQRGSKNVGIHEFVHLLDASDGAIDGVPERLLEHGYVQPWLQRMHQEMREIRHDESDIDDYALTNEGEFLSVAAEYFFQRPEKFARKHPELYACLREIFDQAPGEEA
jgi:Mlc titration factor MtfA (ptsG expression regulator)